MKKLKYEPLGQYLERTDEDTIRMTFKQINDIIEPKYLPKSAYKYQAFWCGSTKGSPSHSVKKACQSHGYIVEKLFIKNEEVLFIKISKKKIS